MPSTTQEFHSGAEGTVTAAGVDWNVKEFDFTETVEEREVTNTSDWDSDTKRVYVNVVPTKSSVEGTFSFDWDALNSPIPAGELDSTLRAGNTVPVVLALPDGRNLNMPRAFIKSMPVKSEGPGGIFSVECQFRNAGKYTFN